jgi:hypothetical protein
MTDPYRLMVLRHYGGNHPACVCCGCDDLPRLVMDHRHGGGNVHRDAIGRSGSSFTRWLIDQGYPPGYDILCERCNTAKGDGDACMLDHTTDNHETNQEDTPKETPTRLVRKGGGKATDTSAASTESREKVTLSLMPSVILWLKRQGGTMSGVVEQLVKESTGSEQTRHLEVMRAIGEVKGILSALSTPKAVEADETPAHDFSYLDVDGYARRQAPRGEPSSRPSYRKNYGVPPCRG